MLDYLLNKYADTFHKNFPIFQMRSTSEAELIQIIEECIRQGKALILPDPDSNILY